MKKFLIIPFLCGNFAFAQYHQDSIQFRDIATEILNNGKAYNILYDLTKNIGQRLSGSDAYEKAVLWGMEELKIAGADKVWLQPVEVPVWIRGKESLFVKSKNGEWKELAMTSLGNSEGTKGRDLIAQLIVVQDFDEFEHLSKEEVEGKIVLFNYPFRQDIIDTYDGYGDAGKYRWSSLEKVVEKGGVAVLVRSISTAFDDVPHTGVTSYGESEVKIPAIAIGPKTADALESESKKTVITMKINSNATMKGTKLTHQVIGEIAGAKDNKVIVVGGHLDSWDVGEGAHDDGAGVVQSIEVIRTFKNLNIRPNHTIRVVLFANEENGSRGGATYADSLKKNNEPHIFGIESDLGGYSPRGFFIDMSDEKYAAVQEWLPLFEPYGVTRLLRSHAGADINHIREFGVELAGLMPDSHRYFDLHHSHSDVFEAVNRRELLMGATVMTQLIYLIDKFW